MKKEKLPEPDKATTNESPTFTTPFVLIDNGKKWDLKFIKKGGIIPGLIKPEEIKSMGLMNEHKLVIPCNCICTVMACRVTLLPLETIPNNAALKVKYYFAQEALECSELVMNSEIETRIPIFAANKNTPIEIKYHGQKDGIVTKIQMSNYIQKPSNMEYFCFVGNYSITYLINKDISIEALQEHIRVLQWDLKMYKRILKKQLNEK